MKQSIDILLATHEPHTPIGQLEYERLRGNAVYHFSFHPSWLQSHPSWALSGDLSLSEEQAKRILSEVKAAMRQWRKVATACHISPAEQQRFASRLDLFI